MFNAFCANTCANTLCAAFTFAANLWFNAAKIFRHFPAKCVKLKVTKQRPVLHTFWKTIFLIGIYFLQKGNFTTFALTPFSRISINISESAAAWLVETQPIPIAIFIDGDIVPEVTFPITVPCASKIG